MKGSKLNICYNTLDRHLEKRASQVAFHWEGNDPKDAGKITYAELHKDVCKFANVLRSKGVKKVCIIYCKPLAYLVKVDAFIQGKNRQSSSQIYFLLEVKTITKIAGKWDC